jgi:HK97 family phage major capsid protein
MKLTKEDLIALLQEQVKSVVSSDDFSGRMKDVVKEMITEMQNNIDKPFSGGQANHLIQSMPFVKIDGDYLTTNKGSVINLKSRNAPWKFLSKDLTDWVVDFSKYLKTGSVSKLLSESVDTAGGYLVPEEFRALMIMYESEPTAIWQRATVWPMNGEKISFPKLAQVPDVNDANFDHFAGVSFAWTEEGGEKAETEPEFGLVEMIVHELAGYTEITNTLLDDSVINLMNYLTRIFRAAWFWYTDRIFIQGTGGKQPLGIINDPGVITQTRQTASTVEVQDVIDMDAALPAVFDPNAVFFYSKKVRAALRGQTVSDSSKELVLQETYKDLAEGYSASILGRPAILIDGKIPTIGSTGDLILGDWRWYYIGFRTDFSMDSSRHYKFRNNRTALRCSGRVDGQAAISQAFVVLSSATS